MEQRSKLQSTKPTQPDCSDKEIQGCHNLALSPVITVILKGSQHVSQSHLCAPSLSKFSGKPMKEKQGKQWASLSLAHTFKWLLIFGLKTQPQTSFDSAHLCRKGKAVPTRTAAASTPCSRGNLTKHTSCTWPPASGPVCTTPDAQSQENQKEAPCEEACGGFSLNKGPSPGIHRHRPLQPP